MNIKEINDIGAKICAIGQSIENLAIDAICSDSSAHLTHAIEVMAKEAQALGQKIERANIDQADGQYLLLQEASS